MAKKPLLNGSLYSPWQVLTSANAYFQLSLVYTDKLPVYINGPFPDVKMEEGIASATNRVLAVELYLKALLIGASVKFPAEHDLPTLFECLPKEIQREVEANFDKRKGIANNPNVLAEVIHWFQLTDKAEHSIERAELPQPVQDSLRELLIRNRRAFMESRYLFDKASFEAPARFIYEHLRLAVLCSVLCDLLEASLLNRNHTYIRTFSFVPSGPWLFSE